MAFGGVETGIMNPMLAPRVAPSTGSMGRTPAACDTAIATGTIMFAAAVFEVASDSTTAVAVKSIVSATVPCDGSHAVMPRPIASARPVENANPPIASPPPYRSTMPQSIRSASSHVKVNRLLRQSIGIILQLIDSIPTGPINVLPENKATLPSKKEVFFSIEGLIHHFEMIMTNRGFEPPIGEAYGANETANGELGYYLASDGNNCPYRARCRPPNLSCP